MIIRRKMPRVSRRRRIGGVGKRVLQRSVDHVRRMVVSRLPETLPSPDSSDTQATLPNPVQPYLDSPLIPPVQRSVVQPAPQNHSAQALSDLRTSPTMPSDLQRIFDRHLARGDINTKGDIRGYLEERAARSRQEKQQAVRSRQIQQRPDNVHYEPPIQRKVDDIQAESQGVADDFVDFPEQPELKPRIRRSSVEYVNVPSPDKYPQNNLTDVQRTPDDMDFDDDEDFPDTMPGGIFNGGFNGGNNRLPKSNQSTE